MSNSDRPTPPDSIPALATRVEGAEAIAARAGDWSFEAYQTSKKCLTELVSLRKELNDHKGRSHEAPRQAAFVAICISVLTALYVVTCVVPR